MWRSAASSAAQDVGVGIAAAVAGTEGSVAGPAQADNRMKTAVKPPIGATVEDPVRLNAYPLHVVPAQLRTSAPRTRPDTGRAPSLPGTTFARAIPVGSGF